MQTDIADLKAGQVRLDARVDKVGNRLHGDIKQVRHETASAYFTAKGWTDQIGTRPYRRTARKAQARGMTRGTKQALLSRSVM